LIMYESYWPKLPEKPTKNKFSETLIMEKTLKF